MNLNDNSIQGIIAFANSQETNLLMRIEAERSLPFWCKLSTTEKAVRMIYAFLDWKYPNLLIVEPKDYPQFILILRRGIHDRKAYDGMAIRVDTSPIKYNAINLMQRFADSGYCALDITRATVDDLFFGAIKDIDIFVQSPPNEVTVKSAASYRGEALRHESVIEIICSYLGLEVTDLLRKTRQREYVYCRQLCHYFVHYLSKYTLTRTGQIIGNKNHSTVLHSIRAIANQIETDAIVKDDVVGITKLLLTIN